MMRSKSVHALHKLLRHIESNLGDLVRVKRLNQIVLREILHDEEKIQAHRSKYRQLRGQLKLGRRSRQETEAIRRLLDRTNKHIEYYFKQISVWKSFGDALAFLYLDKYSVKHAYFETESIGVRAQSGMLMGKSGLKHEIACLQEAIEHGIPAVLCDITNVLRYGDVCLLTGPDPYCIEVKSQEKLNQRGKRQLDLLRRLGGFLEKDEAENFRGFAYVKRVELKSLERNHIGSMNECIEAAEAKGFSVSTPEKGLTYIAIYEERPLDEILPTALPGKQVLYFLNSAKSNGTWGIYYPYPYLLGFS